MEIDQLFDRFQLPGDFTTGLDTVWLYRKIFPEEKYVLLIRPVCLQTDISLMHRWASHPHARKFWQMECGQQELYKHYLTLFQQKLAFAFLVYLNKMPVAQSDVYQVIRDEVTEHYAATPHDYGIHLLLSPYREVMKGTDLPLKNLSVHVLITMLSFLFSFDSTKRIIAEPDRENKAACKLAEKAGFGFMKEIQMSYKKASLYYCDRENFLKEHGG